MPQFILDVPWHEQRNPHSTWNSLDAFTQGFIEAMFFTETTPAFTMAEWDSAERKAASEAGQCDGEIPSDCGFADLHKDSLAAIIADCDAFRASLPKDGHGRTWLDLAFDYAPNGYDERQAGRDYWLTRNGHGVGFWDRGLGQIGDDLSAACGWRTPFAECYVFFGDHVDHGNAPFVHVDGLRVSEVAA